MGIKYILFCRKCYEKIKETLSDRAVRARKYNSYFICSQCSFETDRGYAVPGTVDSDKNNAYDHQEKAGVT